MNNPLVSIITPSFNSGEYIEQAIQSVIGQNYSPLEHLIIDGGSTDRTLAILRRYDEPVIWVSEPDGGQAEAINKGFRQAQGEIIGWLNADDTYQTGAIQAAAAYLTANPKVDLVYGNYNFINREGKVLGTHTAPEFSLERLLHGDAIIPQTSMFFRRTLLNTVEGVDPNLHHVMDWEFTLRLALRYNGQRVAETWANFRLTPETKSVRQPEKFWPEIIAVLNQVLSNRPANVAEAWLLSGLSMAHLLAVLEFARMGQLSAARQYAEQYFNNLVMPNRHPAVLASSLHKAAVYPWHSAFQPHVQAEQALDNLSNCLTELPPAQNVLGYLFLYRAVRKFRGGAWQPARSHLAKAGAILKNQIIVDWPSARMVLGALLKYN